MWEYVFSLWGMIIIVSVCGMLGSAIAVIAKQVRKAHQAELNASLKAEMIKQGRSVEEIERILTAGHPAERTDDD